MKNADKPTYKTRDDVHANRYPFKLDSPKFGIFGERVPSEVETSA
jgi:hypothetical protein